MTLLKEQTSAEEELEQAVGDLASRLSAVQGRLTSSGDSKKPPLLGGTPALVPQARSQTQAQKQQPQEDDSGEGGGGPAPETPLTPRARPF